MWTMLIYREDRPVPGDRDVVHVATLKEAAELLKAAHIESGAPNVTEYETTSALLYRGRFFTVAALDAAHMWEIGPRGGVNCMH